MEFYATVSSEWWGTTTTPAAAIMQVTETGWDAESVQQWYVKYTGNYRNNLVWAGEIGRLGSFENSKFKVQNDKPEKNIEFFSGFFREC